MFIIIVYVAMKNKKTHELKCVLEPFQMKWDRKKLWEFRKNDRDFQVGDTLWEREYNPENNTYTGREIWEEVLYIIKGPDYGVPEGFAIMSTRISGYIDHNFEPLLIQWAKLEKLIAKKRSEFDEDILSGEYNSAKEHINEIKGKLDSLMRTVLEIEKQEKEDCGCPDKEEEK